MLDMIEIATAADLPAISAFYKKVCEELKVAPYSPEWAWPIYPNAQLLQQDVEENQIIIGYKNQEIAAAGVIRRGEDPDYQGAPWQFPAPDPKIAIIHLYAVGSAYRGQGVASEFLQTMMGQIKADGYQVIHLDAVKTNVPAVKLYAKNGFQFVVDRPVDLGAFGVHTLRIMEYLV